MRLLARIATVLRPGGIVALEPQPWRSYEQVRSISRELRASHARLRLHPDDMEWWLAAFGLEPQGVVGAGAGYGAYVLTGFSRPVVMYQKNATGPAASLAAHATLWSGTLPCAWVPRAGQ